MIVGFLLSIIAILIWCLTCCIKSLSECQRGYDQYKDWYEQCKQSRDFYREQAEENAKAKRDYDALSDLFSNLNKSHDELSKRYHREMFELQTEIERLKQNNIKLC